MPHAIMCVHGRIYGEFARAHEPTAPARPTLTSIGSTRADSAKLLIFCGMVALNMSVWRWYLKNDSRSRIWGVVIDRAN